VFCCTFTVRGHWWWRRRFWLRGRPIRWRRSRWSCQKKKTW